MPSLRRNYDDADIMSQSQVSQSDQPASSQGLSSQSQGLSSQPFAGGKVNVDLEATTTRTSLSVSWWARDEHGGVKTSPGSSNSSPGQSDVSDGSSLQSLVDRVVNMSIDNDTKVTDYFPPKPKPTTTTSAKPKTTKMGGCGVKKTVNKTKPAGGNDTQSVKLTDFFQRSKQWPWIMTWLLQSSSQAICLLWQILGPVKGKKVKGEK